MKGWRPPAWAAEATKQKKMILRERGKAQVAQQKGGLLPLHQPLVMMDTPPERSGLTSSGTAPTPQLPLLRDRLISPEPGEVVMQEVVINQCPRHSPKATPLPRATVTSSAAATPAKRKGKGKSKPNNDLPPDVPPLSANTKTWAHFMHLWQLGQTQVTDD